MVETSAVILAGPDGSTGGWLTGMPGLPGEIGGLAEKAILAGSATGFFACLVGAFLAAYFIGNISPSTMLAKAHGIDIKKEGSGNAGTTNALRVLGKKAAVITLVIDILKGVAAVLIGTILAGQMGACGCALFVMLGHIWPMLYGFKGGKGIATSFGALLTINPLLALVELGIVALVTLVSKRMSVGSIAGLVCLPFMSMLMEPGFVWISVVISIIMIIKHRANIVRLIHGEEPKLGFLDREKKKEDRDEEDIEKNAAGGETEQTPIQTQEDVIRTGKQDKEGKA